MLNLDTHILISAFIGDLSQKERRILRREEWAVSSIVLWEIAKLKSLGRVDLELDSIEFSRAIAQVATLPITLAIAAKSTELDFVSDPADEIIAATSIVHKVPLLTRDKRILRSKLVPFA
ncbi:MAG: type II toxin-antitoxin system VapC family toxin [Deltaproteobacteria bacterium]|nr:type II toxin-antitoxin system VapC family toxin [Deltaproteobacteria bacterium]